jgi:hypothetical protein
LSGLDTHAGQAGAEQGPVDDVAETLEGFFTDMKRIGRGQHVAP